jgi:integrase
VLALGRDETGRKRQKWVGGFRTKREVEAALTEALERLRVGMWGDPGRTTIAEYCREWLVGIQPTLRPSTFASYTDVLERWVLPRVGHVRLADLTPTRVRALDAELLKAGGRNGGALSTTSVRYAHRVLSKALKDAVEQGLLPRNPASVVRAPRAAHRQPTVWSPAELRAFLEFVADDRLAMMWLLLAMTGLRRGEVAAVRWSDVDLDAATIRVRAQRVAVEYEVYEYEPKTRAGRRLVALDP